MDEQITDSSWIFEPKNWHNKIFGRSNGSTATTTTAVVYNSNLAAGLLLSTRASRTTHAPPNEGDEKPADTTQTRGVQRRRLPCSSHYRVGIIKSLAIGAVAVTLLISAQAAGEKQGSTVGSLALAINLGSLADFNLNNIEFKANNLGEIKNIKTTVSPDENGDDDEAGYDLNNLSAIRSSRDVEQQQGMDNHLKKFSSGESFFVGELSFQRVGRGYLNFRKPTNPSSYRVLNIVSDPSIDIVPTTQGDLNEVNAVYNSEFTSSANSVNNNNNRLELRKNNPQNSQLISMAGPSNSDKTIMIDKIKGIDLSLRSIMAEKKEPDGMEGSRRDSRSFSDDIECNTNKFDRIITRRLSTSNSLSRPIMKTDGRFDNPFPTWHSVGPLDLMKFVVTESDESGIPRNKEELDKELPILKPNFEVDLAKRKDFRVTWIGHATTLIQIDGLNILTDPIFSDRASPIQLFGPRRYRDPACTLSELPRIDIVLVSHNHYDHLDTNSVKGLNDRFGNNCRWIVPLGVGEFLQSMSVNNYVELDWWQKDCFLVENTQLGEDKAPNNKSSISLSSPQQEQATTTATYTTNSRATSGMIARSQQQENRKSNQKTNAKGSELDIYMTPNQHWSRRGVTDVCKTLWGSYVIVSSGGSSFFFAGDTGYCSAFKEIRSVFGPMKGAAIPIGAYQPRWFMKSSHVDPHEAVQIHRDLDSAKSVAIHHSTFALANEYYKEPPRLLREIMTGLNETVKAPFIALKHGETADF